MARGPRIVGTTPGGSEEVVYDSPAAEPEFTVEPCCYLDEISAHVERHLGPIATVIHEIVSPTVHIDTLVVAPTAGRDFWTFVTAGMSHLRMHLPDGVDQKLGRAELVVALPTDRFAIEQYEVVGGRPEDYLLNGLHWLARFPHENGTWFGHGHTLPIGRPIGPDTQANGFLFARTDMDRPGFDELALADGEVVNFYAVLPLHEDEMAFKLECGVTALLERMQAAGVTEIFDPARPSVLAKKPSALGVLMSKVWPSTWRQ